MPPPREMPQYPVPWHVRRPRNSVASEERDLGGRAMPQVTSPRGQVLRLMPEGASV